MKKPLSRLPLYPGSALLFYPVLLFAAFLLAQGIKTPVTHMLFWTVVLLPVGVVAELIIIRVSLRVDMSVSDTVTEKHEPIRVNINVANKGPLPVPYARMELYCTDPIGRTYVCKSYLLSLLPFSVSEPEERPEFDFRGEYSLETDCLLVSDLFRMAYLRIPCKYSRTVTVLPRRVTLPERKFLPGSSACTVPAENRTPGDDGELSDVREYRNGDSPKRIHWKLSSKSEDLTVRDLSRDNTDGACILCDLYPPFGGDAPLYNSRTEYSDTADLSCIDAVTESAVAAAARELESGGWAEVCWFEYGEPTVMRVETGADLERLAIRMTTLRPDTTADQLSQLVAASCQYGMPIVIVSPRFDEEAINRYAEISVSEHIELVVCSDCELFADGSREAGDYAICKDRLAERGITAHFVTGALLSVKTTL